MGSDSPRSPLLTDILFTGTAFRFYVFTMVTFIFIYSSYLLSAGTDILVYFRFVFLRTTISVVTKYPTENILVYFSCPNLKITCILLTSSVSGR